MKLGNFDIDILSDGIVKFDGGSMFGVVPRVLWEKRTPPDRQNRIKLGLNCLLIQTKTKNILVDTGVGSKEPKKIRDIYGLGTSRLLRELKSHELSPKDINIVILSHLHFDHAGGATKFDRSRNVVPTFPKAMYMVQRSSFEDASNPDERSQAGYHEGDFVPLFEKGRLELLNGDTEVLPGLYTKVTGGHVKGHQIVVLNSGGHKAVFLADFIPTHHHLNLPYISAFDLYPMSTLEEKKRFLDHAEKDGWLLIFGHDTEEKAGYVEKRGDRLHLKVVEV
ncbi:MAG: MBL fold metallo-hydrolase [Chloroflexi bacterium]|nr:MBL fold metallo-hydrolase [Chloroflexota bacterium]